MKRILVAALFVAAQLGGSAVAGERFLTGPNRHFFSSDMGGAGIDIYYDTDLLPGSIGGTQADSVNNALERWEAISCTQLIFDTAGVTFEQFDDNFVNDGKNAIVFKDLNEDQSPGVLASTVTFFDNGSIETRNGINWARITNFDIWWNDTVAWGTPAEIDDPGCVNLYDFEAVALHEIGHGIGYGHPCDSGESCPETEKVSSVMFWSVGPCTNKRTPAAYDLETHSIAYGLGSVSSFSANTPSGPTPLAVTFTPLTYSSASILSTTWSFGDGQTQMVTGSNGVSHTYVSEGRYTVTMTINGDVPACGGPFSHVVRQEDFITACDTLVPEFTFNTSGRRVFFESLTEGSAAGCLQELVWDFGDGATSSVRNPIHDYAEGGTYSVTLTAKGPANPTGITSDAQQVKTGGGGGGCACAIGEPDPNVNSAAAAGALLAAVAMSIAASRRRSRS